MKRTIHNKLFLIGLAIVVLAIALGCLLFARTDGDKPAKVSSMALVSSVTTQADGSHRLCSDYANTCFTYPDTWARAKILSGSNFYGETSPGGVELNPPTGTVVTFTKSSSNTDTICKGGSVCHIHVASLQNLQDGLYLLSASFESANIAVGSDRYSPFVAVLSGTTLTQYGLANATAGKSVRVESFNPVFSVEGGHATELLATPGNAYGPTASAAWLSGNEAASMQAVLSSISARK